MDDFFAFSWLFRILGRFFSLTPKIRKEGRKVIATSGWLSQLLCLGFAGRTVTIDPELKIVRIQYRSFWLVTRSRRIQFDWIASVLYGWQGIGSGVGAYDEGDSFTVGLGLKNGEDVTLFRFSGQGGFVNNSTMPDWALAAHEKLADLTEGPQEGQSLMFAEIASDLIGVPLENPVP